jgi:hypothetical protein
VHSRPFAVTKILASPLSRDLQNSWEFDRRLQEQWWRETKCELREALGAGCGFWKLHVFERRLTSCPIAQYFLAPTFETGQVIMSAFLGKTSLFRQWK